MVLRAMRERGLPAAIATYHPTPRHYTGDVVADFIADDLLLDMQPHRAPADSAVLERALDQLGARMVVQAGAPLAYAQLARLRERRPDIRQMDWIFNTGPHFRSLNARPTSFDAVMVESAMVRERLEAVPGMGRVIQVPSGVDLARFRPAGRALQPPSPSLVIGYVGRLSAEKNPLGFLDLAERLHQRMPSLRFALHGEGPQAEAVKARIAGSPARDAIRYEGFAPHPTDAFAAIDVLVLPSILDGRPAILMEANACGIPVIASPVGGIPEMMAEGHNGLATTLRETDRIAAALAEWQARPEALAALRTRCRAFAEAHFDRRAMLDRYEAAFRETLCSPSRAPAVVA